jgi:aspartyl/asparaginyl-tRNA synthetase
MDVLAPGVGEIIGGSQREERLEILDRNMAERGIDRDHYAWYRDRRRYGTVPHAGFGLAPAFAGGTLAYVTGLANVRDAIPFPRTPATSGIEAYYSRSRAHKHRDANAWARRAHASLRRAACRRRGR